MRWTQKPPLGVQIDWSKPITRGLIGCLLFTEGGGDKVYDLSGHGNTGTLTNMAFPPTASSGWNPGKTGPALAFDGNNDYVEIGDFEIVYPFTIVCWAKTDQTTATEILVSVAHKDAHEYHAIGFGGAAAGDPLLAWTFEGTSGVAETTLGYSINTVYQVAGVFISGTDRKVYVDGANEGTNTDAKAVSNIDRAIMGVSADSSPFGYFSGLIEEVLFFSRIVVPEELRELCKNPYGMFDWPMPWLGAAVAVGVPAQMMHYMRIRRG